MKRIVIISMVALLCAGCSTLMWSLDDPNIQQENQPIRELRVVAFLSGWRTESEVSSVVEKVNEDLTRQTGISLKIIEWRKESLPQGNPNKVIKYIEDKLEGRKDYDIGIAFTQYHPAEFFFAHFVGVAIPGGCDNFWARYIVIYELTPTVLKHEIWHLFLYNESSSGIMLPIGFRLLPLTPPINLGGGYLTKSDREKVLRNKWRDFNVPAIEERIKDLPKYDWKQIHFPHWKEKYPEQFKDRE